MCKKIIYNIDFAQAFSYTKNKIILKKFKEIKMWGIFKMIDYIACDFFATRLPILSLNHYFNMFSNKAEQKIKNQLFTLFEEEQLKEPLAIASIDSYNAINRFASLDSSKASEKISSTLLKYYIRLSTRPTPYGAFSGLAMGNFAEDSNMYVSEIAHHTKRARVDMEWLYVVIREIESNHKIKNLLKFKFNDFVFENGDRLEKLNKTFLELNSEENESSTTIRNTRQVQIVRELSQDFVPFSELLEYLSEKNPGVSQDRIEVFLEQLVDNEFLISELRPPLVNTDTLEYVIHILERINFDSEAKRYLLLLTDIKEEISQYNLQSIGSGLHIFESIISKMQNIYECKNYLQIDTKLSMESNQLSYQLKQDLEEFVSAMVKITPQYKKSAEYTHYIRLFLEKYGYGVTVPVLELLDPDKGLSAPSYYLQSPNRSVAPRQSKSLKEERLEKVINRKLIQSLKIKQKTIEIDDNDIQYIAGNEEQEKYIDQLDFLQSFELLLLAHPRNIKDTEDKFSVTLAPVFASDSIGKTFGRFRDMFSEKETTSLSKELSKQKEFFSDYVVAEIAEVPERGRTSNVSMNISDYDYQIMLSTNGCEGKKQLSINDLYIGVDKKTNQFFIKSKSLNKRVLVTMSSMLNPLSGSNAVRFLREISSVYRYDIIGTIAKIVNVDYEYCPRIVYKHVIIRPETWVISKDILNLVNGSREEFNQKFIEFRQKWNVPRYVLLTEFDNRLLLDLENPLHVNEVYSIVKKENTRVIKLAEMTCDFDEYAAKDKDGNPYVTEIVVPFVLSNNNVTSKSNKKDEYILTTSDVEKNALQITTDERLLIPGQDDWFYFKLYGYSKRKNELIAYLYNKLESLIANHKAKQYFFIRYSDPEQHLRVRVRSEKEMKFIVFDELISLFVQFRDVGLISEVVVDTYEREIVRYGGTGLIEDAEKYFFYDSRAVMKIIYMQQLKKEKINLDYIGVSFITMAMEAFQLSLKEREELLNSISKQSLYRKEFQQERRNLIGAVNLTEQWKEIRNKVEYPYVYDYLTELFVPLKQYADKVYQLDQEGSLTNTVENIMRSVIHMFCNRLVGNNNWENKIYALTRHATHDLKGMLEHRI